MGDVRVWVEDPQRVDAMVWRTPVGVHRLRGLLDDLVAGIGVDGLNRVWVSAVVERSASSGAPFHGLRHAVGMGLRVRDAARQGGAPSWLVDCATVAGLFWDAGHPGAGASLVDVVEASRGWWEAAAVGLDGEVVRVVDGLLSGPRDRAGAVRVADSVAGWLWDAQVLECVCNPDMVGLWEAEMGVAAPGVEGVVSRWGRGVVAGLLPAVSGSAVSDLAVSGGVLDEVLVVARRHVCRRGSDPDDDADDDADADADADADGGGWCVVHGRMWPASDVTCGDDRAVLAWSVMRSEDR